MGSGSVVQGTGNPQVRSSLLLAAGVAALAARCLLVALYPDGENDAYGHYNAARAVLADPGNWGAHWVWLPTWHLALAALLAVGIGHAGVRLGVALLASLGPLLLDAVLRAGHEPSSDASARETERRTRTLALLLMVFAPLPNRLATSALVETAFSLLLLCSTWALLTGRWLAVFAALGLACMCRYEAWGVVLALVIASVLVPRARLSRVLALASLLPVIAYVVLRRWVDGGWLRFLLETHAFGVSARGPGLGAWFLAAAAVALALGPALLLFPFGLPRTRDLGQNALRFAIVPLGLAGFVGVAFMAGSIPPVDRYLMALTPYVCVPIARACVRLERRWGGLVPRVVVGSIVLTLAGHLTYASWRGTVIARFDPMAEASTSYRLRR